MKWLDVIKGSSSTLNWIFFFFQQRSLFENLTLQSHSAHSPAFRRKSSIPGKALHYKNLGHNFKASDIHFTCLLVPEKGREAVKLYFD
ncbi:MAG: hypothetical protein ACTJGD_08640 [Mesonia hippocampi]|uniref:hypothetical protein n=1 Tax=Mesonia hippocampi TaxID=1628250 RepID=UPI003F94AFF9